MKVINYFLLFTIIITSGNVRSGGFFGDLVNLVAPGLGTSLDEAHDEFKDRFDLYKDVEEGLTHAIQGPIKAACTVPFEVTVNPVIAGCSNWDHRLEGQDLIEKAKALLIENNIFGNQEFDGVQIRWCPLPYISNLNINTAGLAPDSNRIYLDTEYRNKTVIEQAALLAHEMTHIRQFRRLGTQEFKCEYSIEMVNCSGCQDENNSFEREAFEFQESVKQNLSRVKNIQDQLPPIVSPVANQKILFFSAIPQSIGESYAGGGPIPENLQELAPIFREKTFTNILAILSYDKNQSDYDPNPNDSYYQNASLTVSIPEIGLKLSRTGENFQMSVFDRTEGGDQFGIYARSVNVFESQIPFKMPSSFEFYIFGEPSMLSSDQLPDTSLIWKNGYLSIPYKASDGTDRWVIIYFTPTLQPSPTITLKNSSVSVSLNTDPNQSQDADWWFVGQAPWGELYYYLHPDQWFSLGNNVSDASPFYQGPLLNMTELKMLDTKTLSSGQYTFYFGVDINKNGILDFDKLNYSSFVVNIP